MARTGTIKIKEIKELLNGNEFDVFYKMKDIMRKLEPFLQSTVQDKKTSFSKSNALLEDIQILCEHIKNEIKIRNGRKNIGDNLLRYMMQHKEEQLIFHQEKLKAKVIFESQFKKEKQEKKKKPEINLVLQELRKKRKDDFKKLSEKKNATKI